VQVFREELRASDYRGRKQGSEEETHEANRDGTHVELRDEPEKEFEANGYREVDLRHR